MIIFSISLLSCNSAKTMINNRLSELNGSNDDEIADARFQKIIEALENRNKEALKKLFSAEVLKEATDIDGGIDYIMDFYKGKMKSNKRAVVTSESQNYGEKKKELECSYKVTTDVANFSIHFIEKVIDTKNPNNVGVCTLDIMREEDGDELFHWGNEKESVGIYIIDTDK